MERPRSLKPWGRSPGHSGPTWRTAVGLLVAVAVLSLLLEGWWILSVPETLRATPRVVEVPAHKGVMEVAEILDDAGVIRSRVGFVLLAVARGSFRSLKAGEYQIPPGTNTVRVLLVGESAIQGYPQPRHLCASAFLQLMLQDAWPDRRVEVINLGTTAIACASLP